ncbi:MAG: hypothetical protein IJI84_04430 [Clostridia bacterium]|nr:hypothetical protein [Clostridia bacterium]
MVRFLRDFNRSNPFSCDGFSGNLKMGVVIREKDKEGLNRVKVRFPDENIESMPASVSSSFAGFDKKGKSGSVVIPQNGEEVIVGFLDGDINRPVILGSLYTPINKPPMNIYDSKNQNSMMFQFQNGLKIQIDTKPKSQKVSIITEGGHSVILDDTNKKESVQISNKGSNTLFKIDLAKGEIILKAKSKISFSAGNSTMTIDKSGGVKVQSGQGKFDVNVQSSTIKAKSNFVAQAGAKAVVKGNANAVLQSSGQTVVKGAIAQIN